MSETVAEARPDTSEAVALHRVFRDALESASDLVAGAVVERPEAQEAVAGYYGNVLAFLRAHHEAEEAALWPRLRERCPDEAIVPAVIAEHEALDGTLTRAEHALVQFSTEPTAQWGGHLVGALLTLQFELEALVSTQERQILPLAAEHLSVEEWAEITPLAFAAFGGDRPWLVLGLVLDASTEAQAASLLERLPEDVRAAWQGEDQARYETFLAELRG